MASDAAIRMRDLGKCFPIFSRPQDRLKQMFSLGSRRYYREFWAVKHVTLEIARGETVAIVGRNGSGKSTLLQLICGTLTPTTGELQVEGRIAALLELGAGFNPEFTGRENVFLNAAILGLRSDEIADRFDAIAAFADIGEFLEQPIKTYSSGMYARLAFAVAINVDPDILVIDEALSVGDEAFQRKCFSRIATFRERGKTILFVSHSAPTVIDICDRAILLDAGERLLDASPRLVISYYQKLSFSEQDRVDAIKREIKEIDSEKHEDIVVVGDNRSASRPRRVSQKAYFDPSLSSPETVEYLSSGATISGVHLLDREGERVNVLVSGEIYRFCYSAVFDRICVNVRFGMMIKTVTGLEMGGIVSHPEGEGLSLVDAGRIVAVEMPFRALLNGGTFFCNAGVVSSGVDGLVFLHRLVDALIFRVQGCEKSTATGMVDLRAEANPPIINFDNSRLMSKSGNNVELLKGA